MPSGVQAPTTHQAVVSRASVELTAQHQLWGPGHCHLELPVLLLHLSSGDHHPFPFQPLFIGKVVCVLT